jgi:Ca2+-binding RTX toxin-like protein
VAVLLGSCGSAQAATISSVTTCNGLHGSCSAIVSYKAGPGEANDVTAKSGFSTVLVRDAGAPLDAGRGCQQRDEHEAECTAGDSAFVLIETLDGNDRVTGPVQGDVLLGPGDDVLDGVGVNTASGGPGNDVMFHGNDAISWYGDEGNDRISATGFNPRLEGGPGDDVLEGGDGNDILNGGPGSDVARGLGGDDVLVGDDHAYLDEGSVTPAADSLDGGPGNDLVTYTFRTVPVTVDLSAAAPSGAAGEGDMLTSVEGAAGGSAADVLTGDGGANVLLGGPGDDTLTGAGGNDVLDGGEGFDRISAGAGNDTIADSTSEGGVDAAGEPIDCGDGSDVVESVDLDVLAADCETARFAAAYVVGRFRLVPLSAGPRAVTFAVRCPSPLRVRRRCPGQLSLSGGGVQERRRFSVPKNGGTVTVRRPPGTRVLLALRYRRHPGYNKRYGLSVYLDLPAGK